MDDGRVSLPSIFTVVCLITVCVDGGRGETERDGEEDFVISIALEIVAFDDIDDDGKTSKFDGVSTGNEDVGLVMSADGENKRRKNEPNLAIRTSMFFRSVSSKINGDSNVERVRERE